MFMTAPEIDAYKPVDRAKNKKLDRLKKRSDFLLVQKAAQKWVSKSLILQVADNDGRGRRVGFTVSKKISKSAVIRNRIKRRLRAASAEILPQQARDNTDYVLIGRADTATKPYQDILGDLAWCVRRLGYELDKDQNNENF